MINKLSETQFAEAFGTTVDDLPTACRELIARTDFGYHILEDSQKDSVILDVLKRIESDQQKIAAEGRRNAWENGWAENLQAFEASGHDLNTIVPKFIRPGQIVRLNRQYVKPTNPTFELDYLNVLCQWLFPKYLTDATDIYEFGCGTGMNLVTIARLFPGKRLHGLDFVQSAVALVNRIGTVYRWNITGHLFDMMKPDEGFAMAENSVVLTFGSIEQLAGKFENFLQFLLSRSPALCISVEPTIELYDDENLLDYLAIKFHRKRGYSENYLSRLRELESEGKVEIMKAKRLQFGSKFMEGYSCLIWRPLSVTTQ